MIAWLKSWFQKADDVVDEVVFTPEHMRILVEDFFALLRAGVILTPSPLDDALVRYLEGKVNKDLAADVLSKRLKDLV